MLHRSQEVYDFSSTAEIFAAAIAAREMLEHAWSVETAYQGITLQPDDVPSRGQCGVSSLWFARYLQHRGVSTYFTEGLIHLDGLGEEQVWVEARLSDTPDVVDLTSDQYRTANAALVHLGRYDAEHGAIGNYEPLVRFQPGEVPRKKLLARFAILESNIARLPRRHRMRVR